MADTKITALTALTAADPANDVLPIVDVSDTTMAASGTTKKISVNNILGASGTATLASATITGDLTVDTSTLKVDSANDRVGVGITSPLAKLDVRQTAAAEGLKVYVNDTGATNIINFRSYDNTLGEVTRYAIACNGVATWSNVGGVAGTAMTLNATGLGVGTIPGGSTGSSKIAVVGGATYDGNFDIIANFTNSTASASKGVLLGYNNTTNNGIISAAYGNGTEGLTFWTHDGSSWGQRMELTATGNVGIGVTPSAWVSAVKGLQVGAYGAIGGSSSNFNMYGNLYSSAGGTAYLGNGYGTLLQMTGGQYVFYQAGNNTSGAGALVPVLNPAMTLDSGGNLLVGTVSPLSSVSGSSQIALGGAGLQTTSQAISAATATTICRSGSGGMAVVGGYNGTGQYSAIIIFSYGAGGGVTVVSSQNNTGSTITYALSGVNVQVTSSLALTNLTTTCIRTA